MHAGGVHGLVTLGTVRMATTRAYKPRTLANSEVVVVDQLDSGNDGIEVPKGTGSSRDGDGVTRDGRGTTGVGNRISDAVGVVRSGRVGCRLLGISPLAGGRRSGDGRRASGDGGVPGGV
jgi:hypothetical protein